MPSPTITRTDMPGERWEPLLARTGFKTPVYKLAPKPFLPYSEAKKIENNVFTSSLEVAGRLVELGFCLRMHCPDTNEQNMIRPENLNVAW